MKTIQTVNGNPILEVTEMTSAGQQVPAGINVDRYEYGVVRTNLGLNDIDTIPYTEEIREIMFEDLCTAYGSIGNIAKLKAKMIEFDLLKLKP